MASHKCQIGTHGDLGEPTLKNSFLVGCLNPAYQGTNVHVGSPQPTHGPLHEVQLFRGYHVLGINRLLYMVLCYVGGL